MKQSRTMSLIESATNIVVGYGLAVGAQLLVFPWFGLPARLSDALGIGAIFTLVSLGRSYSLRRIFEAIRVRKQQYDGRDFPGRGSKAVTRILWGD